ncbi:hypothetical protein [Paraconexibacter algicola]|uniref:Glycoside hydrolase family 5 domain-containing protein n=1 Tax=Paraconexibacter algicola TaxID=2133960 RepID=A0A2T4UKZ3_9ACTN|nr:hypothetical protein [Paraconexibacter algicola]PTL59868.1 hypothetical protein C7Y72_09505 [Paraconexibacter algicola]
MRTLPLAALCAALVLCATAGAGTASAALSQESTFQDDNRLIYDTPENVAATLDELKALGVDRLRVSVFWKIVAPDAQSRTKPAFDAGDPTAYPPGSWDRYDSLLRQAAARGLAINLNLTSPAPLWATGTPEREDIAETFEPSAREFGLFTQAVAERYNGSFTDPRRPDDGPLPRVDYWTIWNEPNQAGWLTPQWTADSRDPSGQVETAPRLYRDLVDASFSALETTGHGSDTILIGETAPKGLNITGTTRSMKPGRFIRQLYCLDDALVPLQGTAAEIRGCPPGADAREAFAAAHPGLFRATGYAHHPYELTFSPTRRPTDREFFTIANLSSLKRLLATIYRTYAQPIPGGGRNVPLYLTEFGYQTRPPDPTGVTLATQARFLNLAEFVTARDPDVRTHAQFLLVDDKPLPGVPENTAAAWGSTFQTGLLSLSGKRKPAYAAYKLPIVLPKETIRRGQQLRVWGLVRPAPAGRPVRVAVELRSARRGSKWRRAKTVTVTNQRHYLDTRVSVRTSGSARLVWVDGSRKRVISRSATFKVTKKRR